MIQAKIMGLDWMRRRVERPRSGLLSAEFWQKRRCFREVLVAGRAQHEAAKPLPGILPLTIKGLGIGALCAVLGIVAAPITVPLLCAFLPVQRSIGTSAALGFPLAVTAAAGYFLGKTPAATCPSGCAGSVYLAGAAAIAIAMIFTVPVGAYLTHVVPKQTPRT